MSDNSRYQQAKQVTFIGALVNALLGFIKLFAGIAFHSHALVADGVHSFADLGTDVMVVLASKYGSQDADASHPYGHQRIETAATFILALLLILAGLAIAGDAIIELINKDYTTPGFWTLPVAILSIVSNEALFHYTRFIGRQIQSDLIIANAWHHRSDAGASLVVLCGLMGSLKGFSALDAMAAIIVGGLIIKMGLSYGYNSIKELVDTAVEPHLLTTIHALIEHTQGVEKIHQLRTRRMAGDIFVDVHILVSPFISVSEGHYIAQHVHQSLIKTIERIKDVTVHVDPEDDETTCPSVHLPNRHIIESAYLNAWQQDHPNIKQTILHYLNGSLSVDLILNDNNVNALKQRITDDLAKQSDIKSVRLLSHATTLAILDAF